MRTLFRTSGFIIALFISVFSFGQSKPQETQQKTIAAASSYATFTLKTAPIRYLYGPNGELEFRWSEKFSVDIGYQYMFRDFVAADVHYSPMDNLGTFSLYAGNGNRVFLGARFYFPKKANSPNSFYLSARVYSKVFSFSDSISVTRNNGDQYTVWYREDQTTLGTQFLIGYTFSDSLFKSKFKGDFELFFGLGFYSRDRKTSYWIPPMPNRSEEVLEDLQTYSSPQITIGMLIGLGI